MISFTTIDIIVIAILILGAFIGLKKGFINNYADIYCLKDTFQGNVTIKGKINSLTYTENNNKKTKEENILSKLFK